MRGSKAVVGVFTYLDDALRAIENAKAGDYDFRAYSPFANHALEDTALPGKSAVRRFTSTGSLLGITFGFTLAIMCSLDYPMRVSAKDIVSVPAFFVAGYECTILFGALCTLLALFHLCRLPDVLRKVGYDPRFSDNKFGIVVSCPPEKVDEVVNSLKSTGAEDVEVRDAL